MAKGKTALVTGASRGIGRAIAIRLASDGVRVAVGYLRNKERADEVVETIAAAGGTAVAVQADLSRPGEVVALFDQAERAIGALDIVVANAADIMERPLADCTEEDYDRIFGTNAKGVFFVLQQAARRVKDGGRIIVSSTGGTRMFFANQSLYLGSKGAVEQFVRSLAVELGDRNITVNAISPGPTDTDMMQDQYRDTIAMMSPFRRIGQTDDVADVAVFLAGHDARWITGQNIAAGGGVF
ncbi:SDR family oxidoreductase [Kribbella sp. VKM Ac-2566]|uniref:SDR family oxidoreductase n=1 Tax=Kribbella sp. VKM Ac-2566 TaxID=2512218 RepID=UPI0010628F69|nr:SDR family oxidoreductase [Kribbella sp. VKM Ac-2566]TDX08403.1 3-oxoacyl-[acyl-carrier protein] reductase [Kribbella sp. VKM Ac-2566]